VHYLFGGVRLQGAGERMTAAARAHLTALVAVFVLLKAVAYFLDQRGLVLSHNGGTGLWGAGYTDVQALLPAKEILAYISVVVAVAILVFSNAFIRNLVWPGIAIGMLALSAVAIGGIYPAAVQTFTVKPNIRDKEAEYIRRSIEATRNAFGLAKVQTESYAATAQAPPKDLTNDADTVGNIRLLDPSVVSSTYTQLQQVRGFYDFTQKLDIDRYNINGKLQDYVVGVRELDYHNLTGQQTNWQNQHTVFTHGYGFTAAPANQTVCSGQPLFVSGFLDKQSDQLACQSEVDQIPVAQPRIYYGENMDQSEYAIVGKSANGRDVEYDRPTGSADQYVTYDGNGGIPVGSYWRRMLYAYKFRETNFLISSVFNNNSKIMYFRDPRERVSRIAPFLTLDGDPYPAVIGGRILWILDGYTTSSFYPYSDQVDLKSATNDALTGEGFAPQTQQNINYLRNSVKATVDAYTGEVKLYQFGQPDPILQAWNKAFGGKYVSSDIPAELAAHFRYPEDQFKVQRELLTRFHVTDPQQFYSGQDFWQVPEDPAPDSNAKQAPYYLLAKFPKQNGATFQLTAAMTPRGRQNLVSLITGSYVDGQPTLQILKLPDDTQVFGPGQADQKMTNDNNVRPTISQTQISAKVTFGNLLSLPVGGGMLYVEPLYVKSGSNPYLQLKYVLVNFGQYVGFADTLPGALQQLLNNAASGQQGNSTTSPPSGGTASGTPNSGPVAAALDKIDKALKDLKAAQQAGDFVKYGQALQALQDAVNEYDRARQQATTPASPAPSPSGSPGASPTPSVPG
jgi:uncharacterized membrane protein (UPF0182 family)